MSGHAEELELRETLRYRVTSDSEEIHMTFWSQDRGLICCGLNCYNVREIIRIQDNNFPDHAVC